jgi:hypothetical protein
MEMLRRILEEMRTITHMRHTEDMKKFNEELKQEPDYKVEEEWQEDC